MLIFLSSLFNFFKLKFSSIFRAAKSNYGEFQHTTLLTLQSKEEAMIYLKQ